MESENQVCSEIVLPTERWEEKLSKTINQFCIISQENQFTKKLVYEAIKIDFILISLKVSYMANFQNHFFVFSVIKIFVSL